MPLLTFILDCNDPDAVVDFWMAALRYHRVHDADPYIVLGPDAAAGGEGPLFMLQRVPEPKSGKNRMHLDIHVDDVAAEVERLVGLGAQTVAAQPTEEHAFCWQVMADPEGNEFCVCQPMSPATT